MIRLVNRHPSLRLELERKVPASLMWISEALRRSLQVPTTIEPLVERVIYPGPGDPDLWLGLERRPPSQPPTIAFVGRLEEQKGPSVAYRALAALRDRHGIDAQLKLAGRGSPTKLLLLERLAKELGIEERVELLGHLDRAGVGSLLAGSSALLVPSTWQEPFGLVLVEAALARVPVVGSRSGGMPEALEEDAHALFFPIGDAAACADALARVLTDAPRDRGPHRPRLRARHRGSARTVTRGRPASSSPPGWPPMSATWMSAPSNEAARRGRRRSRAADAGVNMALFLLPR